MNERYLQDERQLIKMKYSGDIWYQQMYSLDSFSINREYSQENSLISCETESGESIHIYTDFEVHLSGTCSLFSTSEMMYKGSCKMVNCDSRKLHVTWKYEVFFASR